MANIITFNKVVDILKDIATRHYQINSFFLGKDWELENNQDVLYPVLQVYPESSRMPISSQGEYKTLEMNLNCKIVDLVKSGEQNEQNVHSDCLRISQDVVNELNQHPFYTRSNASMIGDVDFTSLEEYNDDFTAGWQFNINIRLINHNTYCGLPFEDIVGYSASGPDSTGFSYSVQYLTCQTVTACTSLQTYVQDTIDSSVGAAFTAATYISSSSTLDFTTIGGSIVSVTGITTSGGGFSGWTASTGGNSIIANNGSGNVASANMSIAGGQAATASGAYSVAMAGISNKSEGNSSFVGAGQTNTASTTSTNSGIAAGNNNFVSGGASFIGAGVSNAITSTFTSIVGGQLNRSTANYSFIGGGFGNTGTSIVSTIAGGDRNKITGTRSFIGGGFQNSATTSNSVVVGGAYNLVAGGGHNTIGGGRRSQILTNYSVYATIGGGYQNRATNQSTTVAGGQQNSATTMWSTVAGGYKNWAAGNASSVVGGRNVTAIGNYSFAFGYNNRVTGARSSVLGGQNLTGTSDDTVYVPYLNITNLQTTTAVKSLGIDVNGFIVSAETGSQGNFLNISGGTVTGDTVFTQGLSATSITAGTYYNIPTVFGSGANGNGGTVNTGVTGYITMGHSGRITGWDLVGAPSGNCVMDVWKTSGNTLPTSVNSITDANKPTITGGFYSGSTTLTNWTGLTYSTGDIFAFNVNSISGFTSVTLTIRGFKQ